MREQDLQRSVWSEESILRLLQHSRSGGGRQVLNGLRSICKEGRLSKTRRPRQNDPMASSHARSHVETHAYTYIRPAQHGRLGGCGHEGRQGERANEGDLHGVLAARRGLDLRMEVRRCVVMVVVLGGFV